MQNETTEPENRTGVGGRVDPLVMSLQPCPYCGTRPIDAHKKEDRFGMGYYIVFPVSGCMLCYGKTGILQVSPLSDLEVKVARNFRLEA